MGIEIPATREQTKQNLELTCWKNSKLKPEAKEIGTNDV